MLEANLFFEKTKLLGLGSVSFWSEFRVRNPNRKKPSSKLLPIPQTEAEPSLKKHYSQTLKSKCLLFFCISMFVFKFSISVFCLFALNYISSTFTIILSFCVRIYIFNRLSLSFFFRCLYLNYISLVCIFLLSFYVCICILIVFLLSISFLHLFVALNVSDENKTGKFESKRGRERLKNHFGLFADNVLLINWLLSFQRNVIIEKCLCG